VFAFFVVLVLAVGGLLFWRAVLARPVPAAETCAAGPARVRTVRLKISRDAVRRSLIFASRAPGLLCERAFASVSRRTRYAAGLRAFRPALRWGTRVRRSVMRCVVVRA